MKKLHDLIKGLKILDAAGADGVHCEHDVLTVHGVCKPISKPNREKLEEFGFFVGDPLGVDDGEEYWSSFRWGSC